MPITTRDRKLLSGKAGGVCMLCKRRLTEDAKADDGDVVLGEAVHIVSEKLGKGPRYRPMPKEEVDAYANPMLLCPIDHKIVDERVTYDTEQRLHALKREHEQWVQCRFSPTSPPTSVRDPEAGKPLVLQHIATGKELMSIASHKHAIYHSSAEPRSAEEAELMRAFLQSVTDDNDIWDDIGPSGRIQAEFSVSEDIAHLREVGLVVYAAARNRFLRVVLAGHRLGRLPMFLFTEAMMSRLRRVLRMTRQTSKSLSHCQLSSLIDVCNSLVEDR